VSWLEISIIAVTIIAASALQASIGFGMGMLAAPVIGRIPGSLAGAWLVAALPAQGLAWLVALVVLGGVVLAFAGWAPVPGRLSLISAGAASGVMGTTTSIGGAPMALIWQRSHGPQLRGTMSAFFLVGSTVSLIALVVVGAVTRETVTLALWLIPAVLLGYLLSRYANRLLDHRRLRLVALSVSTLGAVLLIGAQLLG
jgi:uncharacterized membrane protein YfcA